LIETKSNSLTLKHQRDVKGNHLFNLSNPREWGKRLI